MAASRATRLLRTSVASVALLGGTLLLASASAATTGTSSLPVSSTVSATCSVTSNALAFGAYASVQLDAATTLSVLCSNATNYSVGLDLGVGTGASIMARKLTKGAQTLSYNVYTDSARTNVWGNVVGLTTVAGVGAGVAQLLNVYGRINAGQASTTGAYADTLTATITY